MAIIGAGVKSVRDMHQKSDNLSRTMEQFLHRRLDLTGTETIPVQFSLDRKP